MHDLRNMSRDPQTAMELISTALEAYEVEDYDRAAQLAERAKGLANRSSLVREFLGLCLYRQERWQEAARELLTFRRFTGSLDQNHVIADCYRALNRPERALEICHEVSRDQVSAETWAEICIVAAGAHADRGELSEALNSLSRVGPNPKSIEPYHLKLWYVQADLLERTGRAGDAQKLWELIASVDPDYFDVASRLR